MAKYMLFVMLVANLAIVCKAVNTPCASGRTLLNAELTGKILLSKFVCAIYDTSGDCVNGYPVMFRVTGEKYAMPLNQTPHNSIANITISKSDYLHLINAAENYTIARITNDIATYGIMQCKRGNSYVYIVKKAVKLLKYQVKYSPIIYVDNGVSEYEHIKYTGQAGWTLWADQYAGGNNDTIYSIINTTNLVNDNIIGSYQALDLLSAAYNTILVTAGRLKSVQNLLLDIPTVNGTHGRKLMACNKDTDLRKRLDIDNLLTAATTTMRGLTSLNSLKVFSSLQQLAIKTITNLYGDIIKFVGAGATIGSAASVYAHSSDPAIARVIGSGVLATIDLGVLLVLPEAGLIEIINLLLDISIFEVSLITNKDKQALDICDATCSDSDCSVDSCDNDGDPTDPYEGSASDPCTP